MGAIKLHFKVKSQQRVGLIGMYSIRGTLCMKKHITCRRSADCIVSTHGMVYERHTTIYNNVIINTIVILNYYICLPLIKKGRLKVKIEKWALIERTNFE